MWQSIKTLNIDHQIVLSHLGLFMALASWFLCLTEFAQSCSQFMHSTIKLVVLGTLINISTLLLVRTGLKVRTVSQAIELFMALLYVAVTFQVYQGTHM